MNKLNEFDQYIDKLVKNKDHYLGEIIKVRSEFVYNFGYSSEVGASFIYTLL